MKTSKYVPSVCKGDNPQWAGHIILKELDFDTKCDIMEKVEGLTGIKQVRELVKSTKDLYLEVSLKHVSGEECKSFQDISETQALHGVLKDVAMYILLDREDLGNG